MFKIMGRYKSQATEEVDEFDTIDEAKEMLGEYQVAFGSDYDLWIEEPEA